MDGILTNPGRNSLFHAGKGTSRRHEMTGQSPTYGLRPASLRLLAILTLAALFAAVLFSAMGVERLPGMAGTVFSDFDLFHAVARLTLDGRLAEAYDYETFHAAQTDLGGPVHQMTWTYPPPFDLVLAPLGLLNSGVAYLVFTLFSFAFYLWALRKLAGRYFTLALLAAVPATLISLRTGQNGCLMAALAAMTCHFVLASRAGKAGAVLGVMVIKPHVGLGLGLWSIFSRRWTMAVTSLIVVAVIVLLSLGLLGADVWRAFLGATKEASGLLAEGRYPHFRMASVYSTFRSLNASADVAFAAQVASALTGLAAIVLAAIKLNARAGMAVALFMVPTFSPYMYDYDLVLYGPAFALLLPELDRAGRRALILPALALAWIAGGTGLVQNTRGGADGIVAQTSFAGVAALVLGLYVLGVLWRMPKD